MLRKNRNKTDQSSALKIQVTALVKGLWKVVFRIIGQMSKYRRWPYGRAEAPVVKLMSDK